jgi:hypothetical protein
VGKRLAVRIVLALTIWSALLMLAALVGAL